MLFYCSKQMQNRELNTCKQDVYSFLRFSLPTRGCLTSFRQPLFHAKLVYSNISEDYFSEFSDKSCRIK